jgi:hypothetical protein
VKGACPAQPWVPLPVPDPIGITHLAHRLSIQHDFFSPVPFCPGYLNASDKNVVLCGSSIAFFSFVQLPFIRQCKSEFVWLHLGYVFSSPNLDQVIAIAALRLKRNVMLKHDFLCLFCKLHCDYSCCPLMLQVHMIIQNSVVVFHQISLLPLRLCAVFKVCHVLHNFNLHDGHHCSSFLFNYSCPTKQIADRPSHCICSSCSPSPQEFRHAIPPNPLAPIGGYKLPLITFSILEGHIISPFNNPNQSKMAFKYVDHVDDIALLAYPQENFVHTKIPLTTLFSLIPITSARCIANSHGLALGSCMTHGGLISFAASHSCIKCNLFTSVFSMDNSALEKRNAWD